MIGLLLVLRAMRLVGGRESNARNGYPGNVPGL
jgi:hypothetical protein